MKYSLFWLNKNLLAEEAGFCTPLGCPNLLHSKKITSRHNTCLAMMIIRKKRTMLFFFLERFQNFNWAFFWFLAQVIFLFLTVCPPATAKVKLLGCWCKQDVALTLPAYITTINITRISVIYPGENLHTIHLFLVIYQEKHFELSSVHLFVCVYARHGYVFFIFFFLGFSSWQVLQISTQTVNILMNVLWLNQWPSFTE